MTCHTELQHNLHAGAAALNFKECFANATERILLHAAIYNRFVNDEDLVTSLHTALAKGSVTLEVVLLPVWKDIPWMDAACTMLRPEDSRSMVLQKAEVSRAFFEELRKTFPAQVHVIAATRFPAMPLVIVDEEIFCGHYGHSQVLAPEGYWLQLNASVTQFLAILSRENAVEPQEAGTGSKACERQGTHSGQKEAELMQLSLQDRAAFRFVEEWVTAVSTGIPIL